MVEIFLNHVSQYGVNVADIFVLTPTLPEQPKDQIVYILSSPMLNIWCFLGVCHLVSIGYVMKKSRDKISRDFEENLQRHLSISLSKFLQIFREHGEDLIARFDEVLIREEPEELRLLMDVYVNGEVSYTLRPN